MIAKLLKWLGLGVRVVRARKVDEEALMAAMAVEVETPLLVGVLELIDRQREAAIEEAKGSEGAADRMRFYMGGVNALDSLEEYVLSVREQAVAWQARRQVAEELARRGAAGGTKRR